MTLIRGIDKLQKIHAPCVASIGNYDGVHLGHQHVIKTLIAHSQRLAVKSTVITFEPLAKEFFRPKSVQRLTTIEERAQLLFNLGVDQVLCIDFNAEFASYSPTGFVKDILLDGLGVRHLCVGDDFRFGKDRAGDFALLSQLGRDNDFAVTAHDTFELDSARVSSGRVRSALAEGNFGLAEHLLGRSYSIAGEVSKGQQLGRTINFPTANIALPAMSMPISGVFVVKVTLVCGTEVSGVANVGVRPTVDGKENRLEVHLFDFDSDLYGQEISVRFVKKIRDEHKFDSFDELKRQIQKDALQAEEFLAAI
jgi:riboflavin kinase/FMN adenylyltransferase